MVRLKSMASAIFQSPNSCPLAVPCPPGEVSVGGITSWRVLSISLGEDLLGTLGNGIFQKCSHVKNMGHINLLKSKNQSFKDPLLPSCRHSPQGELHHSPMLYEKDVVPSLPSTQASFLPFERLLLLLYRAARLRRFNLKVEMQEQASLEV